MSEFIDTAIESRRNSKTLLVPNRTVHPHFPIKFLNITEQPTVINQTKTNYCG